jgi:ribosomal protein L32
MKILKRIVIDGDWEYKDGTSMTEDAKAGLAYIAKLERKLTALGDIYTFEDCPSCGGVRNKDWVCIECGYDPTAEEENQP